MLDISLWVVSSLGLKVQQDLLLNWCKSLEVHKACGTEALVSSVDHSSHVSHVAVGNVTLSVGLVVLNIVVGLLSALIVLVVVVDVLSIVEFAYLSVGSSG